MANGEWVKGMGSALSTARAADCGGCAAAVGCVCPWPLWNKSNKWKFPFVPYSCILDRFWSPYGAFLKELTNLLLDC